MLASEPIADFSKVTVRSVTGGVPSPRAFCACPQDTIEEILHRRLSGGGGDVRFGQRLETFTQDEQGVSATVKDARGNNTHIRADFLIAADGGRGPVRHQLQIGSERTEAERHYLNIFFRADLTARMQGRTFSQCEVENGRVNGLLISNDNANEWSFHLEYDPQATDPQTFTQADLTAFVRAALGEDRIGDAEVPVEIVATATWSTVVRVAERYREGRVFLVGRRCSRDAALGRIRRQHRHRRRERPVLETCRCAGGSCRRSAAQHLRDRAPSRGEAQRRTGPAAHRLRRPLRDRDVAELRGDAETN